MSERKNKEETLTRRPAVSSAPQKLEEVLSQLWIFDIDARLSSASPTEF